MSAVSGLMERMPLHTSWHRLSLLYGCYSSISCEWAHVNPVVPIIMPPPSPSMQHACRQVNFAATMINVLWHCCHGTLNEMVVKSRELQYCAAVSYETLMAKIHQRQTLLGGKPTYYYLLFYYNNFHLVCRGRKTTPKHIPLRRRSVFQRTTQRLGSDQESKLIWTVLKV